MTRTKRTIATLLATAAIAAPTTLIMSSAEAKPPTDKGSKSQSQGKSQAKQLLKDVAREDRQLSKLTSSHKITRLADDTEAELVANIDEARATLAAVKTSVEAADSTVDTRSARKELRSFRGQNFSDAAHVLRKAEDLSDDAAADPEATAFLAQAEAAALELDATSTRAEVKAAKTLLNSAQAELDDTDDVVEDEDEATEDD